MNKNLFIFFQKIAPQHLLSRVFGLFANSQSNWFKNFIIKQFIHKYKVNMAEAKFPEAENYDSFNDFFTRELKPGSRIIAEANEKIVSPADGVISAIGDITQGQLLQAKGKHFSLLNLLGGEESRAQAFEGGNFATIYLSPKDYHRVHIPYTGVLKEMVYIPGKLFSVNQTTSENIPELFARNERVVCIFETDHGPMALILVGAMIVAGIETVWAGHIAPSRDQLTSKDYSSVSPPIKITKGEEVGRFKLGSTAIVIFGPNLMSWSADSFASQSVQMGQHLGTFK